MSKPPTDPARPASPIPVDVLIVAAGKGLRLGGDIPKQYQHLGGSPVVCHSVRTLLQLPGLKNLLVVLDPEDEHWVNTAYASDPRVRTTAGGATRAGSVTNGLKALLQISDAEDQRWVLVHDAARPLVSLAAVSQLIERVALYDGCGGLLGLPVVDTLKQMNTTGNTIRQTLDRTQIWRAQTPQMFRLGDLLAALEAADEAGVSVTDEASAMEYLGHSPLMVEGAADNIKITHGGDLALAQWFWQQQQESTT